MFQALAKILQATTQTMNVAVVFYSMQYAVNDWTRLGVFTGSQIYKYGQSNIPKGKRFATIPATKDAGLWKVWPIAFVAADLEFFDRAIIRCPSSACLDCKRASQLAEVHIRFRFDKSATNFTIRKYCRPPNAPF